MLTGDATPISAEEAGRLFAPWFEKAQGRILLAVSGGPDSVAMMHLAAVARMSPSSLSLHVATVDHGLRDAAREEAGLVLRWSQALGLPATMLTWTGAKPVSGLQEAARDARYELLRAHADAIDASHIMTAHTLDDQAETVLLRLLRGSGLGGLGAMRPETAMGGRFLVRPFLGIPKARLVASCQSGGWAFAEDPSNASDRFARVRIRKLFSALQTEGLSAARLARLAERLQRADEALDAQARAAFVRLQTGGESNAVVLDAAGYEKENAECRVRLLAMALAAAGSGTCKPAPLRLEKIEILAERLDVAIEAAKVLRTTCGGCRIMLSQGKIVFLPEEARQRGQNRDKSSRRAQLGFSPSAP